MILELHPQAGADFREMSPNSEAVVIVGMSDFTCSSHHTLWNVTLRVAQQRTHRSFRYSLGWISELWNFNSQMCIVCFLSKDTQRTYKSSGTFLLLLTLADLLEFDPLLAAFAIFLLPSFQRCSCPGLFLAKPWYFFFSLSFTSPGILSLTTSFSPQRCFCLIWVFQI